MINTEMAQLSFANHHNQVLRMSKTNKRPEYNCMIAEFYKCNLTHAFVTNPVICKQWIHDLWNSAKLNDNSTYIEANVCGHWIIISEEIIRDVLQFGDSPDFPTFIAPSKIRKILAKMGYKGEYPTTKKKLLPPFWKLLFHVFVSCISGKKSGSDEVTMLATSAIVALAAGWEYNYSGHVFQEMISNVKGNKAGASKFLMYPRFLQMILETKYSFLPRSNETLEVKADTTMALGQLSLTTMGKDKVEVVFDQVQMFGHLCEEEDDDAGYQENIDVHMSENDQHTNDGGNEEN